MTTCMETYDELKDWYLKVCYLFDIEDEYEGQNKKMVKANIFAVQETICEWQISNSKDSECDGRCGYHCKK